MIDSLYSLALVERGAVSQLDNPAGRNKVGPLDYDRSAIMEQLEKLLAAERARLHEPARPAPYVKVAKPASLSTQNDGTSCGAFCYAYVYFQFVTGVSPRATTSTAATTSRCASPCSTRVSRAPPGAA